MYTINRITHNPRIMNGKPCIRGMRITVSMIPNQLSGDVIIEALLADYAYIEHEDILQELSYGALLAQKRELVREIDLDP